MMKSDMAKIAEVMEQTVLRMERISRGKSGARCYKVTTSKGSWIAKLIPEKTMMEAWCALVGELCQPRLVCAKFCKSVEDGEVCTIAEWIDGECLENYLQAHPSEAGGLGAQAAELVKLLHHKQLNQSALGIQYHTILEKKIMGTIDQIDSMNISLPYYETFRDYLMSAVDTIIPGPLTVVHNDIRPENFIINKNGLFLIDFENGGIGEYVQDLAALMITTPPAFYSFSAGFFARYMQHGVPEDFYQKNLLYSVIYILRGAAANKSSDFPRKWIDHECEILYNLLTDSHAVHLCF